MIALFVIVVMALLAAAMGRFLVDSGEKNTVEVRSVRALLAAQSGLEVALYRLFPKRTLAQPTPPSGLPGKQPTELCQQSRADQLSGCGSLRHGAGDLQRICDQWLSSRECRNLWQLGP